MSAAAATSWRPRSTRSGSTRPAASASTSVPRPAASPTSCCSAARAASTRSTWVAASSPSRCAAIPACVSMERTNARDLSPGPPRRAVALAVIDVSFISLAPRPRRRSPAASAPGGEVVALVKPQFEAGRGRTTGRRRPRPGDPPRGPGRSPRRRRGPPGSAPRPSIASPLLGPEGNREFLVYAVLGPERPEPAELAGADRGAGARMSPARRIGFAYNPTNEAAVELAARAAGWCDLRGIDRLGAPGGRHGGAGGRQLPTTTSLVVLGGDGTFLRAARAVAEVRRPAPRRQPRQGRLPLEGRGRRARAGPRPGRPRALPDRGADGARGARSSRAGAATPRHAFIALNDVVVARGSLARVVRLDVEIGPSHLATFIADGLVVASPTGSTGYSLLGRRPDPRPDEPQPHRHADRGLPVGDPVGRRQPEPGRALPGRRRARGARRDRRPRGLPARGRRRRRGRRATTGRSASSSPRVRSPFWDLLRQKVELLPS